jgi:hypothetical protein
MFQYVRDLFRKKTYEPLDGPSDFVAAGIMCYSDRHVLGALQATKEPPYISGLGGKREWGESFMETALREAVEELFEPVGGVVPAALIKDLQSVRPTRVFTTAGEYVVVAYTFTQLEALLRIMWRHLKRSAFYKSFPFTISELILNRTIGANEISHLCLLPRVGGANVHKEFMDDIAELLRGAP